MKPWGKVSSFRGANTQFEAQQTNGQTHRDSRENTEQRGETQPETQIKEDPSSRSKEEPGPLRDAKSEGHNTL
jgi:hypothetical protein